MCEEQEREYLRKLSLGDVKSFNALFLCYYPKVKNFLWGFIKDEEEARDMAQEIFCKLWVKRQSIALVDSFKSYLYRMARNMIYDNYAHKQVKDSYDIAQLSLPYYTDIIEEEFYAKELSLLIDMAVDKMPPQRRNVFIMSRKEGLSNDEIALKLNLNKRTVENHLSTALSELKKLSFLFVQLLF